MGKYSDLAAQPSSPKKYSAIAQPNEEYSALGTDGENMLAGIGKGFVDTGRGVKQLAAMLPFVSDDTRARIQADVDEANRRDAELMTTKAGIAGTVIGNVAATAPLFMVPGAVAGTAANVGKTAATAGNVARATKAAKIGKTAVTAGRILNPTGALGAAGVGATMGAAQPVASDESRVNNMTFGAVGGAAGNLIGRAVGATANAAVNAVTPDNPQPITRELYIEAQAAAQRAGIDWDSLNNNYKRNVAEFVRKSLRPGSTVTPDEAARQALLSSLPKPIQGMKGQLNQDYFQQEREALLSDIPVLGTKLRNMRLDQRQLLVDNLDDVTARVGGTANVPPQKTGEMVRADIMDKYKAAKIGVKALYTKAEADAGGNVVLTRDLADWFNVNVGDEAADPLLKRAIALKLVEVNPVNGVIEPKKAALSTIYSLRKTASNLSRDGGSKGYTSGMLKETIDGIFERNGGDAYAPAIAARRQLSRDFTDNRAVGQIVAKNNTYRMDPLVPDEKIFDRLVVNGSERDLSNFLSRNPNVRPLQAEIATRLRGAVEDTNGVQMLKPHLLQKELDKIGRPKLTLLLGKEKTGELYGLLNAAKLIEKRQGSIAGGSATASRLAMLGESLLAGIKAIPVIGQPAATTVKVVDSVYQSGAATAPLASRMAQSNPAYTAPRNALMLLGAGSVPAAANQRSNSSK